MYQLTKNLVGWIVPRLSYLYFPDGLWEPELPYVTDVEGPNE